MANNSGTYSVRVKLVDDATKGIAQINKKLADAAKPFNRLNAQIAKFGKLSGISSAAKTVGNLAAMATKATLAVAGISSVASVAGVYELAKSFGTAGMNLANMSHSLGESAQSLLTMQNAARLTGVSASGLNGGLLNLSDTLQDAVAGRNVQALQMFQLLGVNIRKSKYEAKSAAEVLPQLADAIQKLDDKPALQRKLARDLGVEELLPYLRQGAAGIKAYNQEVEQFNTMNAAGIQSAQRLYVGFTKLSEAGEGFGYSIGQVLEPLLTPFLNVLSGTLGKMGEWIKANQTLIDQKLAQWLHPVLDGLDKFGAWMQHANFDEVAKQVGNFGKELKLITEITLGVWAAQQVAALVPLIRLLALIPGSGITSAVLAGLGLGTVALTGAGIGGTNSGAFRVQRPGFVMKDQPYAGPNVGGGWFDRMLTRWGIEGKNNDYKNNNPTNLAYYPGQPYVQGQNGRWGVYNSPAEGFAAGLHQMLLDQDRGYDTIAKEIAHRSPASENDTAAMISRISGMMGMDANAPLNLRNADIAKSFLRAVTVGGEGNQNPTDDVLNQGVSLGLGDPMARYGQGNAQQHQVRVSVFGTGFPDGTRATATATGSLFTSAPDVSFALPPWQMP